MKRITLFAILLIGILLIGCQPTAVEPETAATPPSETEVEPEAVVIATAVPEPTAVPKPTAVPTPTAVPEPITFEPTFEETDCFFDLPTSVKAGEIVCGTVTVPEDHTNPGGPTIRIAVVIGKDQSADHQPDPVFVLAGGPGQKLLRDTLALGPILAPMHPKRDIVLFDQRGVGFSEPALECPEFTAALFDNLDQLDPETASQNSYDAIMACRDRLVEEGHNLAAYTTWQNAADVEAIRIALGYDDINLYGGSYGSQLAQAVMRDHPDALRTVIIDSVYPLETSFFVEVVNVSSAAILDLLAACEADADCGTAYPDLQATFFELIDQHNAEPVPVTLTNPKDNQSYDAYLTGDSLVQNFRMLMYETLVLPLLPQTIMDVRDGDYDLMTRLASSRLASYDHLSTGMEFSVLCTDDLIGKTPQDFLDQLEALPPQLRSRGDPQIALDYGIFAICEEWPVEEADAWVKEPVQSDIPTLIISGQFDPVTPPAYADLVAEHLTQGYSYVFSGIAHSPIGGSPCAREMLGAFIEDPTAAPDDSCMTDLAIDFVVPEDYAVSELEPVDIPAHGIRTAVPAGWSEIEPGVFGSPDYTHLLYAIAIGSDLDSFIADNNLTGPYETIEINGRTWQFYEFPVSKPGSVGIDVVSLRDEGGFYDVALVTPEEDRAEMETAVLMPALEAFAVLSDDLAPAEVDTAVEMEPYANDTFKLTGLLPTGWTEAGPGVYVRDPQAALPTLLLQKSYPNTERDTINAALLPQLGLDALPDSSDTITTDAFDWTLYQVEVDTPTLGTVIVDIAQATRDGTAYMVMLQALADEYAANEYYAMVFVPAVEALDILE